MGTSNSHVRNISRAPIVHSVKNETHKTPTVTQFWESPCTEFDECECQTKMACNYLTSVHRHMQTSRPVKKCSLASRNWQKHNCDHFDTKWMRTNQVLVQSGNYLKLWPSPNPQTLTQRRAHNLQKRDLFLCVPARRFFAHIARSHQRVSVGHKISKLSNDKVWSKLFDRVASQRIVNDTREIRVIVDIVWELEPCQTSEVFPQYQEKFTHVIRD